VQVEKEEHEKTYESMRQMMIKWSGDLKSYK